MSAADEKRFEALGKTWTARFDFNAMCRIEDEYNLPFMQAVSSIMPSISPEETDDPNKVMAAAMRMKFGDIRRILREALFDSHPGITLDQTGQIISSIGITSALEISAWAISKALGDNEGGDASGTENPPQRSPKKRTG